MKNLLRKMYKNDGKDRLLPALSLAAFDRSRTIAVLWLCLTIFGVLSYSTFLKREGFPSVNIPVSMVAGVYFADDPAKVDRQIAKPISDLALKDSQVKSVQSHAKGTSYDVVVEYKEGVDVSQASKDLEKRIKDTGIIPTQGTMQFIVPKFGFTARGDDAVISLYAAQKDAKLEDLVKEAEALTDNIKAKEIANVESISVIDPFVQGVSPATGQEVVSQSSFDRYGVRENGQNKFYESITIGVVQKKGSDVITLDKELRQAVANYNRRTDSTYTAAVSASYAPDIKDQISELQRALLEGLIAVLVVGSIIIAIRASLITVISMLTVLAITIGALFVAGYTLNTITLFSLILCLGLIVDDTIIMVEALDAQRRRRKNARDVVGIATRKVSRAMVAATLTAALSFAPLLFVGGVMGSFIRAIPVTVITSLLVSLLVALIFIPLFARYLLLGKKQMGAQNVHEPAARVEAKIAHFIARPMLWARNSHKRLFAVGITAVLIGFGFIATSIVVFQKVTFNIFPPTKDSNGLVINLSFNDGTTVEQAEAVADKADTIAAQSLSDNFKQASYYATASDQKATLMIGIIPYGERDITAPQLVKQLEKDLEGLEGANVKVAQQDVGPPAAAFSVRIETQEREKAIRLAKDINAFLMNRELERVDGTKAKITATTVADPGTYARADGTMHIDVTANFNADDTTTLVTLAQQAVEKEFPPERVETYGLSRDALNFDFGQEDENQDSFRTLALAFPILLLVIYVLLAFQFRSLAQPLLIFMAIPFSLFGITLGLYFTDNAFSFFAMLGFFALIGLSLKNTILLTDYANQLRRVGTPAVDAAVGALSERFRPLIATSLTAAISLIPLALTSPFWEGLAVVLICGLLSSTFLVIVVFPYYYLGTEFLRLRISRKLSLFWLAISVGLIIALSLMKAPSGYIFLAPIAVLLTIVLLRRLPKHTA